MAGPPSGFELEDTPHSNSITLSRNFAGEGGRPRRVGAVAGRGPQLRPAPRPADAPL
jgi:hypothetical protein